MSTATVSPEAFADAVQRAVADLVPAEEGIRIRSSVLIDLHDGPRDAAALFAAVDRAWRRAYSRVLGYRSSMSTAEIDALDVLRARMRSVVL